MVPAATNSRPKGVCSWRPSRSSGSSVPKAVVLSASVSISGERACGMAYSNADSAAPISN